MYVCLCKGITDNDVKATVCNGATTLRQVRGQLGAMTQCGKCAAQIKEIVTETLQQEQMNTAQALFYAV